MKQLSAEQLEALERRAFRSMVRRAAPGILLYPFACLVIGYAAGYPATQPGIFFSLIAASLVLAAFRIYLTVRFGELHEHQPGRFKWLFGCSLIATLVIWISISCRVLFDRGLDEVSFLALLASVIMCNMSIGIYTASHVLMGFFLLVLIVPNLVVLTLLDGLTTDLIVLASVFYGGYLWTAGRRLNADDAQRHESVELLKVHAAETAAATADYQRIFENAHDAILLFDAGTETVLDVNERACEIYGFAREDFIGLGLQDISKDSIRGGAHVERTLRTGTGYRFETVQFRQDGQEMILEVTAAPFEYQGRKTILSINRDVTERRLAEEELERHRLHLEELVQERTERLEEVVTRLELKNLELERQQAEIETKNAEMERFTYTVSHDLRSPLITIRGFLGLLAKDVDAGDATRMRRDMERIAAAVETMSQLLEELLELSRIGRVVNPPQEVQFGALAWEAVARVAGQIAERGVEVEVTPDLPAVQGDRTRLLEVLQNLIENGVSFMGDQQQPRIEIGARLDHQPVVWFVADNGIGIDPRYHDKVFGLFERLDGSTTGTGIGLALVKRIVEVHGGRVWVESEGIGRGSTFCFTLPPPVTGSPDATVPAPGGR